MRIAFDLDGVLADLHAPYVKAALRLFPGLPERAVAAPEIGSSPPDEAPAAEPEGIPSPVVDVSLSRTQQDAVWRELQRTENFWETLAEIEPGTIRRIAHLAEEHRWELLFITSRPSSAGRPVQRQSQRWLRERGFDLPSLYVVHGSRGRLADALNLDVVIDDRPENCLDVVLESRAGSILVWRGHKEGVPNSARRMGIAVVPTVAACLDALVEAGRRPNDGTLLGRLRNIFGLRTRPAPPFLR